MAISFLGKGTFQAGIGDLSFAIPTGLSLVADDLMILVIENANQGGAAPNAEWANAPFAGTNSRGTAGAAGGVACEVYYRKYDGTETDPAVYADTGDHQTGVLAVYRGVDPTTPFDATGVGFNWASGTSVTWTGITTVSNNAWVVHCLATDRDAISVNSTSGCSNGNLSSITERADQSDSSGQGGGVAIWDGVKATPGASGNSTGTMTVASAGAGITLALRPLVVPKSPPIYRRPHLNLPKRARAF